MLDGKKLTDSYVSWLREEITFENIDDATLEITIPILDHHNDHIQLYLIQKGEYITITDDGNVYSDLTSYCHYLSRDKLKHVLNHIANAYGVKLNSRNEFYVNTNEKGYPQMKHMLLQAIVCAYNTFAFDSDEKRSLVEPIR